MTWLTNKAFGMHWGNHQGHRVISISQKCVDQPCVALPFSSTSESIFICVCIQRSELPLKWSRKVLDFIGFSLKKRKMVSEGEYFEYCVSAFKKPWLCISIALPAWQTPGRGRRPPEGSLFYPEGRTCSEQLFKPYLQLLHDTGNESNLLDIRQLLGKKRKGLTHLSLSKKWHLFDVFLSAPLVDSNSIHSGSAMLMLLTVVFVGLVAFFIYKFKRCVHLDKINILDPTVNRKLLSLLLVKTLHICSVHLLYIRKIPWIHVQTEDSHEKEPEVISTVGQNDIMSKVKHSEFSSPKELMEKELEAGSRGMLATHLLFTHFHNDRCTEYTAF